MSLFDHSTYFIGPHHFPQNHYQPQNKNKLELDAQKREACKREGITLVEIPYWWDRSKESLLSEIKKARNPKTQ